MDRADYIRAGVRSVVRRACVLISEHPGVDEVGRPKTDEPSGAITVDVTFIVNLPSEWRQLGNSPSGVRLREVVRFEFPGGFPTYPPRLSLREDFNRNLPHMQPWLADGRPVPCIYDGFLSELLHREGLPGILNQTILWLERAALGTLIDPEQGWEPVRRDSFDDILVADVGFLQGLVDRRGGYRFMKMEYVKFPGIKGMPLVYGQVSRESVPVNRKALGEILQETAIATGSQLDRGKSLALVVWPGKYPSGRPFVNDTYLPETVQDIHGLKERAAQYGCGTELEDGLKWLHRCVAGWRTSCSYPMAVILLARRPFKLIGSASPIELCPYVVDFGAPVLFADGARTFVRPAGHRHAISRSLLSQMAGVNVTAGNEPWTLVGAGSLGSKIACHLARAGRGPSVVIDNSVVSPHNLARHALVPAKGDLQIGWIGGKAQMLADALSGLDQPSTPITANALHILTSRKGARRAWSKKSWAVLNATASLAVREAFGASNLVPTRVIETSLFAGGRIGIMTVEGPSRNPSSTDLMTEFYAILQEQPDLASAVFTRDNSVSRQGTGQGCGSLTMTMSDGRLSLYAAGMSEHLLTRMQVGLPDEEGEIRIGELSENGLGVSWKEWQIPKVTVVQTRNGGAWRVHIHSRAISKMKQEAAGWPDVETGGILMGRLSEVSRVAHVVDVVPAPEDSIRSSNEFVLGTKGLRQRLREYSESVDWSLYCLGTWHSHLSPGGPSATDRMTARTVSLARLTPSIFLILAPTGFHALLAGT